MEVAWQITSRWLGRAIASVAESWQTLAKRSAIKGNQIRWSQGGEGEGKQRVPPNLWWWWKLGQGKTQGPQIMDFFGLCDWPRGGFSGSFGPQNPTSNLSAPCFSCPSPLVAHRMLVSWEKDGRFPWPTFPSHWLTFPQSQTAQNEGSFPEPLGTPVGAAWEGVSPQALISPSRP